MRLLELFHALADDRLNNFAVIQIRHFSYRDNVSISQHGYSITNFTHFIKSVRNHHNRNSTVTKSSQDVEQGFYFTEIQNSRWFIQKQHLRIHCKRTGDSNYRLSRYRQVCHCFIWVYIDTHSGKCLASNLVHLLSINLFPLGWIASR